MCSCHGVAVVMSWQNLALLGPEKEMDLSTPLDAIEALWKTTHADNQLLKTLYVV